MVKSVTSRRSVGIRSGVLAATAAAIALFVAPVQAQTYNAATQFTTVPGQNGVWSYGFSSSVTTPVAFTAYNSGGTTTLGGSTLRFQDNSGNGTLTIPFVAVNDGPNVVLNVPVGSFFFHPGAGGEFSILQFTAPSTASYAINSQFFAGDTNGDGTAGNTTATVFLNGDGTNPLFSSATTNTNPAYLATLILNAGDVVSFAVGTGGDGFQFDSTPANVTIVQSAIGGAVAAPEPGSLALLIPAGLGVVGVVRRRRK